MVSEATHSRRVFTDDDPEDTPPPGGEHEAGGDDGERQEQAAGGGGPDPETLREWLNVAREGERLFDKYGRQIAPWLKRMATYAATGKMPDDQPGPSAREEPQAPPNNEDAGSAGPPAPVVPLAYRIDIGKVMEQIDETVDGLALLLGDKQIADLPDQYRENRAYVQEQVKAALAKCIVYEAT